MTIVKSAFQIDHNTSRLIFLFRSGKCNSLDYDELSWRISQCNQYQFYYLLNEIIFDIPINKDTVQLFFPFVYKSHFDEFPHLNTPLLTQIDINYNHHHLQTILDCNFFHPEQGVIELLSLDEKLSFDFNNLLRELLKKLKLLEEIYEIKEETYIEETFFDNSEEPDENDITGAFGQIESIFKLIRHFIALDSPHIKFEIWSQIDKFLEESKSLNLNYKTDNLDYKFQIVYPIIYSLNEWKSMIMSKMVVCENSEEFNKTKHFFKECLLKYKRLTGKAFINHKNDYYLKEKYKTNILMSYSEVNKMVEWIDNTFISKTEIKIDEQFKFVNEINEKLKITIAYDYSQRAFLKFYEKYFECKGTSYNYDQLYSMVFHFTKMEKDNLGREAIISKRLRNPVSIEYIDFLKKESIRDFIKIFLILKKCDIIKTKITDLIEIIIYISKEIKAPGISKSNIKKIWAASAENKKGVEYLLTSDIKFNNLLFQNYPRIKKLLKNSQKKPM